MLATISAATAKVTSITPPCLILILILLFQNISDIEGNKDAARLFEDLLADYNKLVRPVENNSDTVIVQFKLKLSQLLDVVSFSERIKTAMVLQLSNPHSSDSFQEWDSRIFLIFDFFSILLLQLFLQQIFNCHFLKSTRAVHSRFIVL